MTRSWWKFGSASPRADLRRLISRKLLRTLVFAMNYCSAMHAAAPTQYRLCAVSMLILFGSVMPVSCSPAPPAPKVVPEAPLEVLSSRYLTDRLVELDLRSAAVGRTRMRVMLPVGYDANPDRRYPALFLLHGGSGNYEEWTSEPKGVAVGSSLEQATANYEMLVVMPDGGPGATFLNWLYPNPLGGRPQYETYHLTEIPELLREQFRANGRAAIAGLSAGGFGAGSYAARHPDMFDAMASSAETSIPATTTWANLGRAQFRPISWRVPIRSATH